MASCSECKKRDNEITTLKSRMKFLKGELAYWLVAWNEQRGGAEYDKMQAENVRLNAEIRRLTAEGAQ
jgi:hypothetical protein